MVTIRMIAKRCGCSAATVSKALNGASDISAETAERIRAAAQEMGYIANSAARALKTSRSYNFGVLFEDATNSGLTHEFFSRILNAFKHRAGELGYDISFISDCLGGREISYAEHARYRSCDGVLIASVEFNEPQVLELVNSGIPVVTIDYVFEHCGSVQSDNVQGMRDLVKHIHSLGHERIAFIHGEETAVTKIRIASFYRTCKELGLEVPEEYVLPAFYHDPASVEEATRKLLSLKVRPTCIIYPDDIAYLGGMNELEKQGLSVPGDICVAGYDGIKFSQIIRPRLTTLRQDAENMGISAAEELARSVEEGKLYIPGRIVIPGQVLPGETVRKIK
ncbi:MAG: LacI family transcriptional regulator [Ruminococcaceae bacterium]|nr:LacI family transcriptional regulator [Oscillospiraceae bacterium]